MRWVRAETRGQHNARLRDGVEAEVVFFRPTRCLDSRSDIRYNSRQRKCIGDVPPGSDDVTSGRGCLGRGIRGSGSAPVFFGLEGI